MAGDVGTAASGTQAERCVNFTGTFAGLVCLDHTGEGFCGG